jgi:DNA-binding NarL/FixJ family response regulator
MSALAGKPATTKASAKDALSPQEQRILALVVEGRTNKEIAKALGLSDKTVKNYLSNAFQKLHVGRRSHAAALYERSINN